MKTRPHIRNRYLVFGDLILIAISIIGAYVLRLELGAAFRFYLPSAYWMIGVSLIVKTVIYYNFGLYRRLWVYASVQELKLILTAVSAASVITSAIMVTLFNFDLFIGFPRSVLVIDWLLSIVMVGGLRFTVRLLAENKTAASNPSRQIKRVLIIGAGDAGALVVRELKKNLQLNQIPVGFLDDDPAKQHQQIYGVPVIGLISELEKTIEKKQIDDVIIAIPSAPGRIVRLVADVCRLKGLPFRTMPGIYELLGGKVSISRLREVDITDLLRREPTQTRENLMGTTLAGKKVLVTGAGGSIGRELCRQIARWEPLELILMGHGENSIFETLLELKDTYQGLTLHPIIADIRDYPRLQKIFQLRLPDVVFHAAAHKHVPLMELNIEEAVTNNILGTQNIVNLSVDFKINQLVMISSDKAIRPVNVMGGTKRIAELLVLDAADRTGGAFSVVRFGNVLGSRGSVVPLFKRQISKGGPVTITHPDMQRYFMTIPEAVNLVLQAAGIGRGGETFVLNMGQQVRILDLAEDLIRLSGLEPGRDIEIIFTGIRPGEKLSEDLWDKGEQFLPTDHPDIYQFEEKNELSGENLNSKIAELIRLAKEGDTETIITLLDEIIPNSAIRNTPPPEILSIE